MLLLLPEWLLCTITIDLALMCLYFDPADQTWANVAGGGLSVLRIIRRKPPTLRSPSQWVAILLSCVHVRMCFGFGWFYSAIFVLSLYNKLSNSSYIVSYDIFPISLQSFPSHEQIHQVSLTLNGINLSRVYYSMFHGVLLAPLTISLICRENKFNQRRLEGSWDHVQNIAINVLS